jgi:hypothetical protein
MQTRGRGPITSVEFGLLELKFTYDGKAEIGFLNLPLLLSLLLLLINIIWIAAYQMGQRKIAISRTILKP